METERHRGGAYEGEATNPVYGLERRGIDYVPETERHMRLRNLAEFWIGTNLYPFNILIGVLAFTLGLSVGLTILVVLIGIAFSYFAIGLSSVPSSRAGIPAMAVSRAAFGLRFQAVNAALAWAVGVAFEIINASTGVFAVLALLAFFGWDDPGSIGDLTGMLIVFLLSVVIAVLGHATIVHLQRFFSYALGITSVAVLIEALPDLDLGARLPDVGLGTFTAIAIILGIVIAGHVAYVISAPDYPRYLPSTTPPKSIVWTVMWSAGGTGLLLGLVGIILASQTPDVVADPIGGAEAVIPGWLFVPFVLAAIGGSLTNNMLTIYSAGLAAQATGLPLKRYTGVVVASIFATAGLVWVLFIDEDFLGSLNKVVVFTIVWIGPWGAIWIYDAWRRHWNIDPVAAHGGPESPYWGSNGIYWPGAIALIAGMSAALVTISVPDFTGWIADALGGADLSWLAGPLVALAIFIPLDRAQRPTVS
jgi:NCS1 family nucleobase:cation symporter-1